MKVALVLVLALAAPAAADSKNREIEEARNHFKQGKAFQDAGVFERAAEEYKLAYEADPRPEMLFNIAQAYRLGKQKPEALDYFKQYLAKQPNGAGADEARKHVVTLQKEIDDEAAARKEAPPTVLPTKDDKPALVETTKLVDRGRGMRYAGIGIGAAGFVAVGLGIKFGFDARSASDDITKHMGAWVTPDDKQRFEEGERANRNMMIMYGVGGALVITGAVLYYVGHRRRETPVLTYISTEGVGVQGQFSMRALVLLVLAGCFDPSPERGQSCTDWCPPPESCVVNKCRLADEPLPNFAFVTLDRRTLGDKTVQELDDWCVEAAVRARLPAGQYLAWVSTNAEPARMRFRDTGASGWMRTDNVPFAATLDDLLAGTFYAPLRIAEDGRTDIGPKDDDVATATIFDGTPPFEGTCADFTGAAPAGTRVGVGRADAGKTEWTQVGSMSCDSSAHIYCLGVDRPAVLEPPVLATGAKRAFITKNTYLIRPVSDADRICNADASEPLGSMRFAAMLATTTQSVAERFAASSGPWFRTDGIKLSEDMTTFLAPLEVAFDGRTHVQGDVWFGADSLTLNGKPENNCADFTGGGAMRNGSSVRSIGAAPFSTGNGNCGGEYHYYCAER